MTQQSLCQHFGYRASTLSSPPTSARFATPGTVITYSYAVTNTGNVTLNPVVVSDPMSGLSSISCPVVSLAPTVQEKCTATYTTTQADVDFGSIANTGTATGTPPAGSDVTAQDSELIDAVQQPAIQLLKTASPTSFSAPGTTITYSYKVTNSGNVTLTSASVTDPMPQLSAIDCGGVTTLAPSATLTCTATYTTTQADVDRGFIVNTGTATGEGPLGQTMIAEDSATVATIQSPAITLTKSSDPSSFSAPGTTITYSYEVANTGNVTLSPVIVSDPMSSLSAISCPIPTLAPGGSETCTATYTTTQADVDRGSVTNTGTTTGKPPAGPNVTDESTLTVPANQNPAMTLSKSASPTTVAAAGEVVTYTFHVTNTGNVTVIGIAITEGSFSGTGIPPEASCPPGPLAPGASVDCTATYTVTQADIDAGSVANTATATGTPPAGVTPPVSPPSSVTVPVTQTAALTLSKSATPTTVTAAGEVVTYTFHVTNTGNVTVTGIAITEGSFSGSGTPPVASCPAGALAPGASVDCTATYTVTQADIDAGSVANTATATGTPPAGVTPPVSPPSSVTVPVTQTAALTLSKSASPTTVTAVGQVVTYTFHVTNAGNVTVTGIAVTEGFFSGTGTVSPITCSTTTLAPGASVDCTATYIVTQADVDHGFIANTATATGTGPAGGAVDSRPAGATVPVTQTSTLTVTKSATPTSVSAAGDVVTYTFHVTNTGNVTITDPAITEESFSGSGTAPVASCPAGALAPGASVDCTATYTVTQADVDAGSVANTATATGTPPAGVTPPVSPPSSVTVPATQTAALTLSKSASPTTVSAAGEVVTYTFHVTNTGNVTVTGIAVTEGLFSGTGTVSPITCSTTTLAPGASMDCTATYAVTQADVDRGFIANTATATGTSPAGGAVSLPSSVTVPVTQTAALTVVKSASADYGVGGGRGGDVHVPCDQYRQRDHHRSRRHGGRLHW